MKRIRFVCMLICLAFASSPIVVSQERSNRETEKHLSFRSDSIALEASSYLLIGGASGAFSYWLLDQPLYAAKQSNFPHLRVHYDDYLQFATHLAFPTLLVANVKGRSKKPLQSLLAYGASTAITASVVLGGKQWSQRQRPDHSSFHSFPSGHTATAFLGAALFDIEYGDKYPWLAAVHYATAASVGVGRVINNRHWASDVFMGAGVGVFSAYAGYLLTQYLCNESLFRTTNGMEQPPSQECSVGVEWGYQQRIWNQTPYLQTSVGAKVGYRNRVHYGSVLVSAHTLTHATQEKTYCHATGWSVAPEYAYALAETNRSRYLLSVMPQILLLKDQDQHRAFSSQIGLALAFQFRVSTHKQLEIKLGVNIPSFYNPASPVRSGAWLFSVGYHYLIPIREAE